MNILNIQGSSRRQGNTECLTGEILDGVNATTISLLGHDVQPIQDKRHSEEDFPKLDDDYDNIVTNLLDNDTLIFSTPLYWYGMSGKMKNFIDRWTQSLRDPRFDFKKEMSEKEAYVVIVGGDNPKVKALPLVQQFQYIFDFMGIDFKDYIIGEANKPGDVLNDKAAIQKAQLWNEMLREKYAKDEK